MFWPYKAIIRQLSIGGNHHTARTHVSVLPCCYCTSSYLRNVHSHFAHATFMYSVHVVFLVCGFLKLVKILVEGYLRDYRYYLFHVNICFHY
jgi:hypothetical protein